MSSAGPLVTVVIPSFNEEPHVLRASLESIRTQTFNDFECIVIDESSCPLLIEICIAACAEDQRFFYIHPAERLGLSGSLNLGISKARGKLIARFDSDDVCMPDRLARQVTFLEAHPEITLVGGALNIIDFEGQVFAHRSYPESSAKIARGMQLTTTVAHPTVMFRIEAIEQYGGYNPEFHFAEDLDLWLRWINAGLLFANLPHVLVHYRQDNTSRNFQHWRYNLRARLLNFSTNHSILRIIGMFCLLTWAVLPSIVQKYVFKLFLLNRQNKVVSQ